MVIEDTPKMPTTVSTSGLSSTNSITNLAQSSMFWKPTFMTASDWLEHIPFAFWLIEAHKPAILVEIGTTTGVSYFAMCQAVDRLHLDSSCFAIGEWNEAKLNTELGNSNFKALHSHNHAHYSSFSNLLTNSRVQALQHFDDGSIDLIHFKGLKGHDADRQLINSWIPKLSENGLLLLHGTSTRDTDTQLFRLFSDLKQSYPGFEFRQSKGLGVLGIGHHQADLINILFNDAESRGKNQVVQDVFSRLGRACADSYAAQVNDEHTDKLTAESQLLKTDLESAEKNLQHTQQLLEANQVEMQTLETRVSQQIEIQALERGQLVERSSMIQDLYDQLKQDTDRLQDTLQQNRDQLSTKKNEVAELSTIATNKDQQLTKVSLERDQLKSVAAAKDRQASDLENKLVENSRLLEKSRADILDNKARIESLQSEAHGLKQTLSEKNSEIAQSKAESEQKIKTLQKSLDGQLHEIGELVKRAETKEHEFHSQLKAERSRKRDNNPEHDRLVADLQANAADLQAKLKEKESSLAARFDEIATLTNLLELLEKKSKIKVLSLVSKEQSAEKSLETLQTLSNDTRKVGLRDLAVAGKNTRLIEQSGLFDPSWYLARYSDVSASKKARKNPARHYVLYGGFEARDPSELFNSSWYLQQNPDVMKQGINPLIHYLLHGKNEGRLPKPSRF